MNKFHVVVVGSTPEKGENSNKYIEFSPKNETFIQQTLDQVSDLDIAFMYHGDQPGTDDFVEAYAYNRRIRTKQFPAYWRPRHKDENYNKGALFQAHENMIRAALDNAYPYENHHVTLAVFRTDPNDNLLNAAIAYARKCNDYARNNPEKKQKEIVVRDFSLPTYLNSETPASPAQPVSAF